MLVRNHFISEHIKNKQSSWKEALMPIYINYFKPQILVVFIEELAFKDCQTILDSFHFRASGMSLWPNY